MNDSPIHPILRIRTPSTLLFSPMLRRLLDVCASPPSAEGGLQGAFGSIRMQCPTLQLPTAGHSRLS